MDTMIWPPFLDAGAPSDRIDLLWEDGERIVCRRWREDADGKPHAVLAAFPAAERPTPGSLKRLAHEYQLKAELDSAWAVRPLELVRERGYTMLLLEDLQCDPLGRLLGPPMEIGQFLRLAVGLSAALRPDARDSSHP